MALSLIYRVTSNDAKNRHVVMVWTDLREIVYYCIIKFFFLKNMLQSHVTVVSHPFSPSVVVRSSPPFRLRILIFFTFCGHNGSLERRTAVHHHERSVRRIDY
jgi:hypothetical protein